MTLYTATLPTGGTSADVALYFDVSVFSQDIPGNRTRLAVTSYLYRLNSSGYPFCNGGSAATVVVNGSTLLNNTNVSYNFGSPLNYTGATISLLGTTYVWVNHDANGTKTVSISASFTDCSGGLLGNGSISTTQVLPTIPRAPGPPTLTLIDNIVVTGARATFTAPSNIGGSAIIDYDLQVDDDAAFGSPATFTAASSPISATALTPGTTYYARVRATNTQGDGEWSNTLSFSTAAAGAPHVGVVPKWDGSGFYVQLTRPFGVATVQSYKIRRTVPSTLSVTDINVVVTGDTVYLDEFALAAGQTVSYQATATVASVETGLSASVTKSYDDVVPYVPFRPLIVGTFSEGAPFENQTGAWAGTTGASNSLLRGTHPTGWRTFAEGASGIDGVVTQVASAYGLDVTASGEFDVMAIFAEAQTVPGVRTGTAVAGEGLAVVFETVLYYASMQVISTVQTAFALEIEWYTEAEGLISRTRGDTVVVEAGEVVTLTVNGTAPANATKAAVCVIDVDDPDWNGGELRFCGNAMLSPSNALAYFDGDTPTTADFEYAWSAAENASSSVRSSLVAEGLTNSLQDPALPALPTPPRPPVIEDTAVLTDIVWRRSITAIPAAELFEWIAAVPTLAVRAAVEDAQEVRIRYWRNVQDFAPDEWIENPEDLVAEQVIAYIPQQSTFTLDGTLERATVIYDGALPTDPATPADHLLYGEGGGPATWPVLDSGFGYIITFDVPVAALEGNLVFELRLTNRMI